MVIGHQRSGPTTASSPPGRHVSSPLTGDAAAGVGPGDGAERNPLAPTRHPGESICLRPQRLMQSGAAGARLGGAMGATGPPGTGLAKRHQSHRQGTRRSGGRVILLVIPPGATQPYRSTLLDDAPDLTCKDSTGQHTVDDPLLSCNLLPCQERPSTPRLSPRCPAAASGSSPAPARAGATHCSELVAWRGSWQAPSI
jgi:hypothetical protein